MFMRTINVCSASLQCSGWQVLPRETNVTLLATRADKSLIYKLHSKYNMPDSEVGEPSSPSTVLPTSPCAFVFLSTLIRMYDNNFLANNFGAMNTVCMLRDTAARKTLNVIS